MSLLNVPRYSSGDVRWLAIVLLVVLAVAGRRYNQKIEAKIVAPLPSIQTPTPSTLDIAQVVGRSSVNGNDKHKMTLSKPPESIEKANVAIGEKEKKSLMLMTSHAPGFVEGFTASRATVEVDRKRVSSAPKATNANRKLAPASLGEARAIREKLQAEVDRWDSEVRRLRRKVDRGVVDVRFLLEHANQLGDGQTARGAAEGKADGLSSPSIQEKRVERGSQ